MPATRKVLLCGATIGAGVLSAVSGAWACSPGASATLNVQSAAPGAEIVISGDGWEPEKGDIEIRWNTTGGTELGEATGRSFTEAVIVPQKAPDHYFVVAVQRQANGGISWWAAAPIEVLAQTPATTPATNPTPASIPTPATSPLPLPITPATQPVPRGAQTIVRPVPQVQPAPVLDEGQVAGTIPAAVAGAAAQAELERSTEPAVVDDGQPALPVENLWSGLDSDSAPSLGTVADEPPQGSTGPSALALGLVVLGLVGLGAGATAAVPARRRARATNIR
jgi:hypothetical protein